MRFGFLPDPDVVTNCFKYQLALNLSIKICFLCYQCGILWNIRMRCYTCICSSMSCSVPRCRATSFWVRSPWVCQDCSLKANFPQDNLESYQKPIEVKGNIPTHLRGLWSGPWWACTLAVSYCSCNVHSQMNTLNLLSKNIMKVGAVQLTRARNWKGT